ncbi:MFS transporter [Streptomyces sp. NBC_01408]|uniref:MFS transporter n=1 Tax=Streptomyces sp. NBC_01408 TaxID=2903855 RepID=UPI0022507988|nr:MFS transporter [Streptomyces sp. NBC_01408]MCX4696578.1 MFS transporter [Streptomyces sp. NBC_01408]
MKKRFYATGLSDAVGLGMYLSLSVLFFDKAVDLPNAQIGLVLSVAGITSLLGAMPIARAAERFGTRTVLTVLFLTRAAAFLALSVSHSFVAALLASAVAGLLSRGISPLIESELIARAPNKEAVGALARLRSLRNAGMAAGALPSGAAIALGEPWAYRAVMVLSAVLFIGCALVCRTFGDSGHTADAAEGGPSRTSVLRDRVFLRITALYGALTMSALVLGLGVPLWVVQQTQAPAWTVTLIQVLNTALVVVLQVRVSKGSENLTAARRMMRRGGLLSALAAVLVPLTALGGARTDLALVVAAALLFSLGELYIISGTTGAALLHIPEGRKTAYLAAFNLGFAVTTVVGPPLITASVGWAVWGWLGWGLYFTVVGLVAMRVPAPPPVGAEPRRTVGSAA